ncbi:hypothetical protein BDK51DRAFT_51199 [Blyttiomyces helicus]|uniref:Uncharacterized protein n=1 Tax=Blyttiomyces helicus TaxID=388810 RepID=A0A4P9WA72_9FUNG|nr:hypothetical protein BDK51DRAFT_51199 [Blyttiomyces helicus]|eukprot:RKO88435.1 hypothetical protein BDK51DRAFT_51199 [Blyttiomyces helicus]
MSEGHDMEMDMEDDSKNDEDADYGSDGSGQGRKRSTSVPSTRWQSTGSQDSRGGSRGPAKEATSPQALSAAVRQSSPDLSLRPLESQEPTLPPYRPPSLPPPHIEPNLRSDARMRMLQPLPPTLPNPSSWSHDIPSPAPSPPAFTSSIMHPFSFGATHASHAASTGAGAISVASAPPAATSNNTPIPSTVLLCTLSPTYELALGKGHLQRIENLAA